MTVIVEATTLGSSAGSKLATDSRYRSSEKRALIEGPHLLEEALQAGLKMHALIVSEPELKRKTGQLIGQVEPRSWPTTSSASSPTPRPRPGIAAEFELSSVTTQESGTALFLEAIQDPGNVGAILRSAAAFGAAEVVLDRAAPIHGRRSAARRNGRALPPRAAAGGRPVERLADLPGPPSAPYRAAGFR